ncbi:RNA polymerase-binding protein DksA [Dethiosulfatarculus sandiegensis]|uniref:RNA polymerase-binding transcription factor DksA n=1 Tax=Dethiosulfatarculus sandiegensis TaxID=1429043 RepID=A0A0D2JD11_9BACT|nr:RNA polymerase-binding protein DksA [Dethiosulfatarculus sandiegensis]KIX13641.1 conjugal transfer protein TraR [Dethiosulfatarculus sandiegensis]
MDEKQLAYFKNLLEEQLQTLLNEAGRTVAGMIDPKENYPDPTDRAALESDRNFLLRIRDRERKLISKIEEALQRIEDGEYGICESCGDDISPKRLEARPVTTLCIECKKRQEAKEKARGN